MAKKKLTETTTHDFSKEKIFRGVLLSETPEDFLFENEDGIEVNVAKSSALTEALRKTVNGKRVLDTDWLIEIEYLSTTEKDGEPYDRFRVSVEPTEED